MTGIFYFSSTGNSLYIAKRIGASFSESVFFSRILLYLSARKNARGQYPCGVCGQDARELYADFFYTAAL